MDNKKNFSREQEKISFSKEKEIIINTYTSKSLPHTQVVIIESPSAIPTEEIAMMQALYSRSPKPCLEHLKQVSKRGATSFMSIYYVKYGHKSIGDCAYITLFVENISMLAAKAIQSNRLYNGQECSTRYLDFKKQGYVLSENKKIKEDAKQIIDKALSIYTKVQEKLMKEFNYTDSLPPQEQNAIKARIFDITRSLLPASMRTSVAVSMNLRALSEHVELLAGHPLSEIRNLSRLIHCSLKNTIPSSIRGEAGEPTNYKSLEGSLNIVSDEANYYNIEISPVIKKEQKKKIIDELNKRKQGEEISANIGAYFNIAFKDNIDFGSWRDLQRHRSFQSNVGILTPKEFESWYLDNFPIDMKGEIQEFLAEVESVWKNIRDEIGDFEAQNIIPMGYKVSIEIMGDLRSFVYVSELRSGETTHPTLRPLAQKIGEGIVNKFDIPVYYDKRSDVGINKKRGTQTIEGL